MKTTASLFTTVATGLALMACGGSDSTDPGTGGGTGGDGDGGGNGAEPAAIAVVSGSGQSAKTQQDLAQPFVVSVTDADGAAVSGVTVTWSVIDGPGSVSPASSTTDAQGQASATFTGGTTLGTSTVRASASGVGETADFTVETSTLVVLMQNTAFVGPDGTDDVTVPLGATIEWQNRDQVQHTATMTGDAPDGGSGFDSGFLNNGQSFSFTPSVEGTWTYFCEVHPTIMVDATITVTAAGTSSEGPGDEDSPGPGDPDYPGG